MEQAPLCVAYIGASRLTILRPMPLGAPLPAVIPCCIPGIASEMDALLDTGSPYCIMRRDVAEELKLDLHDAPTWAFWHGDTRYEGPSHRHTALIPAVRGQDLILDVAWVVPPDWDGPIVLGWYGFLQSIPNFGCEVNITSEQESFFYFTKASEEHYPMS